MEFIKNILNLYLEKSDFFLQLILQHFLLSIISITISAILGIALGIIIEEKKKLSFLVIGITNFIYTIPSIAILGFLVSLSGVGNITAIITLSIYGLLPMVSNTYTGLKNVDEKIIEAGKGMGSTKFQLLYKIKFPLALPVIFSGFRNMVVMTIALCGIASFIGAGGLGVAIWRGITTNNSAMTCAGSLLIAIIALIVDGVLSKTEKYINNKVTGNNLNYRKNKNSKYRLLKQVSAAVIAIIIVVSLIITKYSGTKSIIIASKPTTEEYILSETLGQLIEDKTGINVEIKKGIGGGTANIQPAMEKGELDMYPEYTGTAWEYVLKKDEIADKDELYKELRNEYKEKYNFNWTGLYGYNSTYALVIDSEIAKEYNIETYSDLAKISDKLKFGAEYDFYEREDGYDALAKEYGFKFKNKLDLDIGLKYQAIASKKVDVINAFSTDAQLKDGNYKVLKDDKNFFPSYLAGTVVRQEVIDKHPEIEGVISLLDNNITEEEIIDLNYQVEVEKKDDYEVAKEFLIEKGLING